MAGTISVTSREMVEISMGARSKRIEKVTVTWVADAADASVPTLSVGLNGYLVQASANPGDPAPTDSYDVAITSPEGANADPNSDLLNWDTAAAETVVITSPPLLVGTYTLDILNNAVNSATGTVTLFLADER
jgi:hypothetical protein